MSTTDIYTLGAVVVGGSSAFNIDGVETANAETGLTRVSLEAGGQPYPSFVATVESKPMIPLTVSDIKTLLDNVSITAGFAFPQTTVYTTVDMWFTKLAQGGVRAGSSAHLRVRMNEGMAVINTISASQGAHATADVTIYPTYDGTNVPFAYTASQSLPHTPSVDELFTLGPVKINGTTLTNVTSWRIEFNPSVIVPMSDGDLYPTYVGIMTMRPRITITTTDVAVLNTYTLTGTAQTSSETSVWLRKLNKHGTQVADATEENIQFSLSSSQGQIYTTTAGGSNNESSTATIIIGPTVGTNPILTVDTTAAID